MVSRQDVKKRRTWEGRIQRFRASGLSVARFCEQERVLETKTEFWERNGSEDDGTPY